MKRMLFFLFIASSTKLFAWGPQGHMIVAQIAEDQLTPKARAAVKKILPNYKLAEVSNWADYIKSDPNWAHTKPWHFVNIPDGQDYDDVEHHPEGDIVTAITSMVDVLKTPRSSDEDKANALKFIVHFVGDLHQPLHAGRPDDRGGNSIKLFYNGRSMNLHSLWDSGMIMDMKLSYEDYARYLQTQNYLNPSYDLPEITFSEIIHEDMSCRDQIYGFGQQSGQGTIVLDRTYFDRNVSTMNGRLLAGGKRLAFLLNQLFR